MSQVMESPCVKFTRDELKACLLKQFKFGEDLKIQFEGTQLVETQREGGCFVMTDFTGAPKLKETFVRFMDDNDSGVIAPYEKALEVWKALEQHDPQAHAVLDWLLFERSVKQDQAWLEEKLKISDRTVRRLIQRGLDFIGEGLTCGVTFIKRPDPSPLLVA